MKKTIIIGILIVNVLIATPIFATTTQEAILNVIDYKITIAKLEEQMDLIDKQIPEEQKNQSQGWRSAIADMQTQKNKDQYLLEQLQLQLRQQMAILNGQNTQTTVIATPSTQSTQDKIQALTKRVFDLEQENLKLKTQVTDHEKRVGVVEGLIKKIRKILKI